MEMRAVAVIPALDCLIYHDLDHWIGDFERRSGGSPTDVVLPAYVETGSSYKSEFSIPDRRLGSNNTMERWIADSRHLLPNAAVWASIIPTLPSLSNDLIALRDQWDSPMGDACIRNPQVQTMLGRLCLEARGLGVDGVVFDLTDIYPNSTSSRYPQRKDEKRYLQNTCFCQSCRDGLKREGRWTGDAAPFKSLDRNLARFVLRPSKDGAMFVDVKDSWLEKLDAAELVDFATVSGFVENEDVEGRKDATELLRYLAARATVTALSVKTLCEAASETGLRTSVILGSAQYDMSQNTNLKALMAVGCADEYWAPDFGTSHLKQDSAVLLRFLATRGTYYFNAIFAHLEWLGRVPVRDQEDDRLRILARDASGLSFRNDLNIGQVAQVPLVAGLGGFVGVPFDKADFIELVTKRAADGTLHERLKTELLLQVETGATKLTLGDQQNVPAPSSIFD